MQPSPAPRWQTPFFTLWTSQALSLFGSSLVQFALIWWLTSTTRSATVLAVASLVGLLPNVVLAPFAGVVVDRFSRKVLMLVSDGAVALVTLGLAYLFATGSVQIWHVYLALFIRSAAGTVQFPAMQASTSLMVPDTQLARIAGLNQMLQGGMGIIAPPIGALLLQSLPMQGILAIDVGTAILAMGILALVRIPQPARQPPAHRHHGAPPRREISYGIGESLLCSVRLASHTVTQAQQRGAHASGYGAAAPRRRFVSGRIAR